VRAAIAVIDQADIGASPRDGHLERVEDELGARVVGERPADDPPAVAVITDARYSHPSQVRM
jgi:hypothetical protein